MRDALAAAQRWSGVRPLALLLPDSPMDGPLSEADRLLMIAWHLDRDALCPGGCGHYLDETSQDDGMHRVERITCDACAASDYDREERKGEPGVPGELAFVVREDD